MIDMKKLLDDNNLPFMLAEQLVGIMGKRSTSENMYCDFHYNANDNSMTDDKPNTFFKYDLIPEDGFLNELKKELFSDEFANLSEEDPSINDKVKKVFVTVADIISTRYCDVCRDIIRINCMPNSKAETMPLSHVEARLIEIVDTTAIYSAPGPYVLSNPPHSEVYISARHHMGIEDRMKNLMAYLADKNEKTGKPFLEIFNEEKRKKDRHDCFWWVSPEASFRKIDWDLIVYFFVDYSLNKPLEKSIDV